MATHSSILAWRTPWTQEPGRLGLSCCKEADVTQSIYHVCVCVCVRVRVRARARVHKCACMLSCFSCAWLFGTPWTVDRQAPLSMGFSREEHWSGWPCPLPGILPDPGIKPKSVRSPSLTSSLPLAPPGKLICVYVFVYIIHLYSVTSDSLRPHGL